MCGRFTLTRDVSGFASQLGLQFDPAKHNPRFNICPSQPVIVVVNDQNEIEITQARWGLVPSWSKAPMAGQANARSEGIEAKPFFRSSFKRRRCLVAGDGFFEWSQTKPKRPYYFRLRSKEVFGFAGLWDESKDEKGETIRTCCLITTEANETVAPVHHRMPVILQEQDYRKWLSLDEPIENVLKLLTQYPSEKMESYEVSTYVNRPENRDQKCIEPVK